MNHDLTGALLLFEQYGDPHSLARAAGNGLVLSSLPSLLAQSLCVLPWHGAWAPFASRLSEAIILGHPRHPVRRAVSMCFLWRVPLSGWYDFPL
eukprot:scaffold6670_cov330-Prasinococcus_capsulatus_cf.AAC.4